MKIHLPLPPEHWEQRCATLRGARNVFFIQSSSHSRMRGKTWSWCFLCMSYIKYRAPVIGTLQWIREAGYPLCSRHFPLDTDIIYMICDGIQNSDHGTYIPIHSTIYLCLTLTVPTHREGSKRNSGGCKHTKVTITNR